jgi:hypothetical protein
MFSMHVHTKKSLQTWVFGYFVFALWPILFLKEEDKEWSVNLAA